MCFNTREQATHRSGVGMATMVTNRFAALQPMRTTYPAQVTTKPLTLSKHCKMTANVNTTGTVPVAYDTACHEHTACTPNV